MMQASASHNVIPGSRRGSLWSTTFYKGMLWIRPIRRTMSTHTHTHAHINKQESPSSKQANENSMYAQLKSYLCKWIWTEFCKYSCDYTSLEFSEPTPLKYKNASLAGAIFFLHRECLWNLGAASTSGQVGMETVTKSSKILCATNYQSKI